MSEVENRAELLRGLEAELEGIRQREAYLAAWILTLEASDNINEEGNDDELLPPAA